MCSYDCFRVIEFFRPVGNSSSLILLLIVWHPAPGTMTLAPCIYTNQFNLKTIVTILCVDIGKLKMSGMSEIQASECRYFWTGIRHLGPPIIILTSSIFTHQFNSKSVVTILCVFLGYMNWSGMQEIHAGGYRYFWTGIRHPAPTIMNPASSIFNHQLNLKPS